MVDFFRKNGYFVIRMCTTQLAMTVFGLILSASTYRHDVLFVLSSVLAAGMYLWLLYTMCWEVGIKDKVRLDGGRIAYQPWCMLWVSLVANALNFLLCVLSIFGCAFVRDFEDASPVWAASLYKLSHDIFQLIHSMYGGIVNSIVNASVHPMWNSLLLLVTVLPAMGACVAGYNMGIHNRTLGSFVGIKPRFDRR